LPVYSWAAPTKASTSKYNYIFNGHWLPEVRTVIWDAVYIAQFNQERIPWGDPEESDTRPGYSWAWRRMPTKSDTRPHWAADEWDVKPDEDAKTHNPDWDKPSDRQTSSVYPQEFVNAYNFSYKNWITTIQTIWKSKMYEDITRIQMAKMLSNFAVNVLWKQPDTSKWVIKFRDVTNEMNKQYNNAVTTSYQLWIMWINMPNNNFRPNDTVTRAEFVTALSRLLYWTSDWIFKWTWKYYIPHMSKLYNEWIINNTNPRMKEKRWYVMIMLMRSIK
jgi:hypothetical protein